MKNKILLLIFSINLINLVSAETDVFPIYEVLVESIFGSIGLAIVGVAIVLALMLLISRTSSIFLTYWMMFYFMVMGTLYIGALALIISFVIGFGLASYNIIRIFGREG